MKYEQQYYMQDRISIEDHDGEFPNLLNELLKKEKMKRNFMIYTKRTKI